MWVCLIKFLTAYCYLILTATNRFLEAKYLWVHVCMYLSTFSLQPSWKRSAVCSDEFEEVGAHLHIEEEECHGSSEGKGRRKQCNVLGRREGEGEMGICVKPTQTVYARFNPSLGKR